jgi:hypothetical protein
MHREFAEANMGRRHVFLEPPDQPSQVADLIIAAFERRLLKYTAEPL